jgi:hypothetical protein
MTSSVRRAGWAMPPLPPSKLSQIINTTNKGKKFKEKFKGKFYINNSGKYF